MPSLLFAATQNTFVRSADSGASWQIVRASVFALSVTFDSAHPGTLYVTPGGSTASFKGIDHGARPSPT